MASVPVKRVMELGLKFTHSRSLFFRVEGGAEVYTP
jgi:hypothetical protein